MDGKLVWDCSMYALLKTIKDEHTFNDPDTMKPYPIMEEHIRLYKQVCPNADFFYNRLKHDEARKARFFKNKAIQDAIHEYHKRYIAVTGPMPPPPVWTDLSSEHLLNIFNNTKNSKNHKSRNNRNNRKNHKNHKNRKSRKN